MSPAVGQKVMKNLITVMKKLKMEKMRESLGRVLRINKMIERIRRKNQIKLQKGQMEMKLLKR